MDIISNLVTFAREKSHFMSVRIQEVISALERFAPLPLQESYDNAGLQMGLTEAEVSGALLCLDVTEEVILEAIDLGCNLIVSHHPVLFHGLKTISDATLVQRCVRLAIQNDLCIYSAHTNLDNAMDGVNYHIAERLGLIDVEMMLDFIKFRSALEAGVNVPAFNREEYQR